jgi:N-acetyl-alpha-D-muramate 1-phosphate uridylyltransferase
VKGVVFAAGLGTRLYPLTKDRPKALVEVQGKTMLTHVLDQMRDASILDVVVNVHAFADLVEVAIREYVRENPQMTVTVSDERDLLLETGGGLKKMRDCLTEPFVVHNVDVLSDVDLSNLMAVDRISYEKNQKARSEAAIDRILHDVNPDLSEVPMHLATLAVRETESDRYFLFNESGVLCGWENVQTGEKKISRPEEDRLYRFGFTGIHMIHPDIFPLITEEGVFSITDVYLRLAKKHDIHMCNVSHAEWFDIGSPEQLAFAEQHFR